ncbi:MAG: M42 family metallopeptidase [Promethearchaeota archaeon]
MRILEIFKEIYHIHGISGHEERIAEKSRAFLSKSGEVSSGGFGSVICHIQNSSENNLPKIMVCAHIDTPGFMIKSINSDGKIQIARLGLRDMRALHHQRIQIHSKKKTITGVLLSPKDETFFVETGYTAKELKTTGVEIGDPITFFPRNLSLSDSKIMSTSVDGRLGLAMLISLAEVIRKSNIPCDVYLVASTREEWGGEGALTTTRQIQPDLGIVYDVTWVEAPVVDGKGPVLTLLDRSVILSRKINQKVTELAKKHNLNLQKEVMESGGSDAGSIARTLMGTPVICLLPPIRYPHSSIEIFDIKDAEGAVRLTEKIIQEAELLIS